MFLQVWGTILLIRVQPSGDGEGEGEAEREGECEGERRGHPGPVGSSSSSPLCSYRHALKPPCAHTTTLH